MPFKSEKQRRFMFANAPKAAHKWAHGKESVPADWKQTRRTKKKRSRSQTIIDALKNKR